MAESYDVAVIGSGPGGYAASIRCAQKGTSVAMVGIDTTSAGLDWAKIQAGKDKDCENRK